MRNYVYMQSFSQHRNSLEGNHDSWLSQNESFCDAAIIQSVGCQIKQIAHKYPQEQTLRPQKQT